MRFAFVVSLCLLLLWVGCAPATTDVPSPVTSPPTATPEPAPDDLVYVIDPGDGRFLSHIFAVDAHRPHLVFTLETRTLPEATLSYNGRFLYVADSYLSRVTRGEQHNVYSVYDARSGALSQADLPLPDRLRYKLVPAIDRPNFFLAADDSRLFAGRYGDPEISQLRLSGIEPASGKQLFTVPAPPCNQLVQAWTHRWLCLSKQAGEVALVSVNPQQITPPETLFTFPGDSNKGFALSANGRFLIVLGKKEPAAETTVSAWQFDLEKGALGR